MRLGRHGRWGMVWGSHPIGPDKMPNLTPFSRRLPPGHAVVV